MQLTGSVDILLEDFGILLCQAFTSVSREVEISKRSIQKRKYYQLQIKFKDKDNKNK